MKDEEENYLPLEQVKVIHEQITEQTKRNAYRIAIVPDKKPKLYDSKFGGVPYWDLSKEYPVDAEGEKMLLLAQINLDSLERLNNSDGVELPESGMLQFFHAADDFYGCFSEDFFADESQKNYRIVYHKTVDKNVTEEQIKALGVKSCEDEEYEELTPVFKTTAVALSVEEVSLKFPDYRYEKLFLKIANENYGIDVTDRTLYDLFSEEAYDMFCEDDTEEDAVHHNMLGYAYFTQTDPREENSEAFERYDTILLQVDSEFIDQEDYVLWGDCGIGNFFINSADLKNQDFSRILYNWDCC